MRRTILNSSRWPAILLCLWMISIIGIRSIPLETHEVFVLQTTREMAAKGDWVLPSFNYEPRLQKPPFNYWATEAVSSLDPFSEDAQVWHGRLVSLLASLAMVMATYFAGKAFFGPATGKLASLMLLSMQGYIGLSHSARPDFLYSAFSVLSLFAWVLAWKAEDGTWRQRGWARSGWILAGLATLTKGPQAPLVFLAGMLAFLLSGPDRRRAAKVLRPFSGPALLLLLVLPWWLLLQRQLATLGVDIQKTQLSGSLLANLAGWKEILSGYYLWTLLGLMLPFSLMLPFLARGFWKRGGGADRTVRLLLAACVSLLIVFTLGGHYRKHYMLPLLPLLSLLLARAVEAGAHAAVSARLKRGFTIAFAVVAAVCAGLILREKAYASLAWILLNAALVWLLLRHELGQEGWPERPMTSELARASAAVAILTTGILAFLPMAVVRWRRAEQGFAESVGRTLQPDDLIVQWRVDEAILPFYARRPVQEFGDREALEAFYARNHPAHTIYAVLPRAELAGFSRIFDHQVLRTVKRARHPEDDLAFVRLTGLRDSTAAASGKSG